MLKRMLSVERTYPLGDYKNIKLFDSISGIPEELAFDHEFINTIRMLQLIQLDVTYRKYGSLAGDQSKFSNLDENISYLIERELEELDKIKITLEKLNITFEQGEEDAS